MPFHIADMALPPRAAFHEAISQDDPYHEDHHLQGDTVLRKLGQDKSVSHSLIWNTIISFLQRRTRSEYTIFDDPPWCLLLAKDRESLEQTIIETQQAAARQDNMSDLQKRHWLNRIRICYTPTIHHVRAVISAFHISQVDQNAAGNSLLAKIDYEHSNKPPTLIAVYDLLDIFDGDDDYIANNEFGASHQIAKQDDLMHILAALSEFLEYCKLGTDDASHLLLYDTKIQQQYTSQIEDDVVVPVAMEISPDSKSISKIFQSWVDWIVESQRVDLLMEESLEGEKITVWYIIIQRILKSTDFSVDHQTGKGCISLVAIPSRRLGAVEDLHWTFEI
ncbi:hypothetical protein NQZ79_g7843 [Umbelopsis isabellina]|nr:hypothetical protein NQZ79_g7843 [Umbelopsis isabellina]